MHDNRRGDKAEHLKDADVDRHQADQNSDKGARADKNSDSRENEQHSRTERRRQVTTASSSDDTDKRGEVSPAHWQGEPLPYGGQGEQTQDVGFDQRGAGRARQYGRAGAYGEGHNRQERRPLRGETRSDKDLLACLHDAFHDSGLDVTNVNVTVDNGVVRLSGHIAHGDDKYVLERLAVNCRGTIAVQNQLDVDSPSPGDSAA